jgi:hypothetical protein
MALGTRRLCTPFTGVATSWLSSAPIWRSGTQWSTLTYCSALRGMAAQAASPGSCTTAIPPWDFTASSPAVPQLPEPVSTMPTTRGP